MSDILAAICANTRKEVEARRAATPLQILNERAKQATPPRGFAAAIRRQAQAGRPAVIAEIKKASPSRGVIRAGFDAAQHARDYAANGATCLSVLTDNAYFQGGMDDLIAARAACDLPVLRKDFMVDSYQVAEARAIGADCILIIMAALDDAMAQALYDAAQGYGMDVLVEVHDGDELDRALALPMDRALIGINNRNLKTLEVSLDISRSLAARMPAGRIRVSESGLKTHDDLRDLMTYGFEAFLIGEQFMSQDDPGKALATLLGD